MTNFTADQYVSDVLDGRQLAGHWVRAACRRHLDDLENAPARGLYFDDQAARMAIAFFSLLRHWKGEWSGEVFELQPWQQFIAASLFGWKKSDGTRRFKTAYLEVARKNGKTSFAAGIGLYLLVADDEPGAEIYTAAVKRDQARIAHSAATEMVRKSPQLKRLINIFKDNLHDAASVSKFEPLGRDADSLDGLNCHGVIADELHAWKKRDLWDILETSTGARRQPLMIAITTAGYDRQTFCFELHEYTEKILDGVIDDDSYFGVIYSMDAEEKDASGNVTRPADDYEDPALWVKANPNLDVSKKPDDMRRKIRRARNMPAALNSFLRLELNTWTQAQTRWINFKAWKQCGLRPVDVKSLLGRPCYSGLDLSSTTDVTALVHVFPPVDEKDYYWIMPHFWLPADNMADRVKRDRVTYDVWQRAGYLELTPGNVVDYGFVLSQVDEDMALFNIKQLAFDRWGSQKIITDLQEAGFTVDPKEHKRGGAPLLVQFGQGFASMAGPMRELEKLILSGRLQHGGHPVLTWMAHNLVVREDPAGNLKPDKEKSSEKIDGMVALVMGLARAALYAEEAQSVYKTRGIRFI